MAVGTQDAAVELKKTGRCQALPHLFHLRVRESDPYLVYLARREEAVDKLYVGTDKSHIAHAGVARRGGAAPHAGALDVDAYIVAAGDALGEPHGIFALAAAKLKGYRIGIAEKVGVPAATERKTSLTLELGKGILEHEIYRVHLAEFGKLVFTAHVCRIKWLTTVALRPRRCLQIYTKNPNPPNRTRRQSRLSRRKRIILTAKQAVLG